LWGLFRNVHSQIVSYVEKELALFYAKLQQRHIVSAVVACRHSAKPKERAKLPEAWD
jgi:hypothetical protein